MRALPRLFRAPSRFLIADVLSASTAGADLRAASRSED